MGVHTAVLGRATLPAGGASQILLTVPSGQTWIVKAILLGNNAGVASIADVYCQDATATLFGQLVNESVPASGRLKWDGWTVLDAGSELIAFAGAQPLTCWVSGTKLLN